MSWLNFQQMDWLAMVLVHSLWIGAAISLILALGIRIFNIKRNVIIFIIDIIMKILYYICNIIE